MTFNEKCHHRRRKTELFMLSFQWDENSLGYTSIVKGFWFSCYVLITLCQCLRKRPKVNERITVLLGGKIQQRIFFLQRHIKLNRIKRFDFSLFVNICNVSSCGESSIGDGADESPNFKGRLKCFCIFTANLQKQKSRYAVKIQNLIASHGPSLSSMDDPHFVHELAKLWWLRKQR